MVSLQASHFLHSSIAHFSERLQQLASGDSLGSSGFSTFQKQNKTDSEQTLCEQRMLQALKNRDKKVKAHELAHTSVGGQYAQAAHFSYEKGSDGVMYAVAGEVSIDTSKVANDPEATLRKAKIIQRAALAPTDPSAQDRQVATAAIAMGQQAQLEIAQAKGAKQYQDNSSKSSENIKSINIFA